MPDDRTRLDATGGAARFRADLLAYLDGPVYELAGLLGELPSSRQEPLQLGVLLAALNLRSSPPGRSPSGPRTRA